LLQIFEFDLPQPSGYASDELDEPAQEQPPPKKTRLTRKAKENAKKTPKENGDDTKDDDEYTAISKSMWSNEGSSGSKPPVGSFEECAECGNEFTVVGFFFSM
jgi:DNA repair protein RAD7